MNTAFIFKRLGFGKNAAKVYEVLFEHKKPLLIAHIARTAGIDRPEVYRAIKACMKMKFIRKENVGKRSLYVAESPLRIQAAFGHTSAGVDTVTNRLANTREKELPIHLEYFKGPSGIRAVFDDVIERSPSKGVFYRYTSERDLSTVNSYLSPDYRVRRDKKKLERLVISNPVSGKMKKSRLERFIKFFPPEADLFDQNIIQLVYGDSVAFINLTTEEGYVIRDRNLADFQTVIFKQLYKKL